MFTLALEVLMIAMVTFFLMTSGVEIKKEYCSSSISSLRYLNGVIMSPSYPMPYPKNIICRYEFIGNASERIQLDFIDFSVAENEEQCYYSDTIEIYMWSKKKYHPVDYYCGNKLLSPIMSYNNRMMVEFRGIYSGRDVRGFKFKYAFVTNFGIKTGNQIGDECSFNFNSNDSLTGHFHSPNFPGNYPINMVCNYLFNGNDEQTVELRFLYFDVEGVFPCVEDDASDTVEFSNYDTRDRKHRFYCGKVEKEFSLKSDGKFFRVTFRSNEMMQKTGFNAIYSFSDRPERNLTSFVDFRPSENCSRGKRIFVWLFLGMILLNKVFWVI